MAAETDPKEVNLDIDDAARNPESSPVQKSNFGEGQDKTPRDRDCGQFRAFWSTRELEKHDGTDDQLNKTTIIELLIYCVFLILVCVVVFSMITPDVYYFTNILSRLFTDSPISAGSEVPVNGSVVPFRDSSISASSEVTFRKITSQIEFWQFLKISLLENLFWDLKVGGRKLTDKEVGYIFYENKLQGIARLRQVRMGSNSCTIMEDFKKIVQTCYGVYDIDSESKDPYGEQGVSFDYKSSSELDGASYRGVVSTYGGGGYVQDLASKSDVSRQLIDLLFLGRWIDRGTRAVFIDFTVYNANVNLFCVVRLLAEFPATGGVITSSEFYTVKLLRYATSGGKIIMFLEIVVCAFVFYYIVEEIMEMIVMKFKYFKIFWNYIDLAIIITALFCIVFNLLRTSAVDSKLSDLVKDLEKYPNFKFLAYWQVTFNTALAFLVFFVWVKLFKYLSFNKTMAHLSGTLSRCASDLFGFAIMFFVIFLAFAQLGYLLFGTQAKDFSTFADSIFTLFRIILGDFNFSALEEANSILGPLYFILYVFFVFFILINMFLAIINDTYSGVKDDLANSRDRHLVDYLKQKFKDLFGIKSGKDPEKPKVCIDWEADMVEYGYAKEHVAMVTEKYCQSNDILSVEMQEQMMKELEEMSKGYFDVDDSRQVLPVEVRMENMQQNFASLVDKIDDLVARFKKSEIHKVQRIAAMSRLLDSIVEAQNSSDEKKAKQIEAMVREELGKMKS